MNKIFTGTHIGMQRYVELRNLRTM